MENSRPPWQQVCSAVGSCACHCEFLRSTMASTSDRAARLLKKRVSVSSVDTSSSYRKADHYQATHAGVSGDGPTGHRAPVRFENSYRTGPPKRFPQHQAYLILKETLESYLADERYEPTMCAQLTKTISDVVKAKVEELDPTRFKIICVVTIGLLAGQGIMISSRCLWDSQNDTFASYEFKNGNLFAVAHVFGVYSE